MVDVRVGDHDAGDVPEGVARRFEACFDRGEPAVGQVRPPHTAVDEGHAVAVGEDVHVDALDRVHPDGERHPAHAFQTARVDDDVRVGLGRHPAHPCMRSSSVNQIRSCTS